MFNIQSAMLALLGFLVANLLVLLLAPAYWRRAVRLTTQRLKQAMPLTEAEIKADKDRLRAEYAIKVYRLEAKAEQSAHDSARQQIELNRRDAAISTLEGEIARLKTSQEEHENARRVLEQTITDRFPRVEQRLSEARRLLGQRDRELAALTESSARQAKALQEAVHTNALQRDEVMRLDSSLAAISVRTREGLADPKFDAEVALRSELEHLRGRVREQAAQVQRLQQAGAGGAAAMANGTAGHGLTAASAGSAIAAGGPPRESAAEIDKALAMARSETEAVQNARAELEAQLGKSRQRLEDQSVEIASLKAALAAYERGTKDERSISLKDSRIAMKVRIGSLQAETEQQSVAIQRMRGELAAANEKLARQAAHFMAEMRRLGAGGTATARAAAEPRPVMAAEPVERRALGPKLANLAARPLRAVAASAAPKSGAGGDASDGGDAQDASRVRGFLKALGGAAAVRVGGAATAASADPLAVPAAAAGRQAVAGKPPSDDKGAPRRLIERISSVTKS